MRRRFLAALPAALVFAAVALAHEYTVGNLSVSHLRSRATAAGMPMGVAYLTLTNRGATDDALLAAHTPVAARVEFHQTLLTDGMARMRPLTEIAVGAGKTVKAESGGIHLMLVDLTQPLMADSTFPMTLTFRAAGEIQVKVKVEAAPQ